jgi:hypothetical protein
MLYLLFKRMARTQDNKDRSCRLAESIFTTEEIFLEKHGLIFIYTGHRL